MLEAEDTKMSLMLEAKDTKMSIMSFNLLRWVEDKGGREWSVKLFVQAG